MVFATLYATGPPKTRERERERERTLGIRGRRAKTNKIQKTIIVCRLVEFSVSRGDEYI